MMLLCVVLIAATLASSHDAIGILDQLSRLGVVAFLIISMYGFYKRWWVFGPTHREIMADRDKKIADLEIRNDKLVHQRDAWMGVALRSTGVMEQLTEELQKGQSG